MNERTYVGVFPVAGQVTSNASSPKAALEWALEAAKRINDYQAVHSIALSLHELYR